MTRRELAQSLREGPYTSLGCYPKFWVTASGDTISYEGVMAEAKRYLKAEDKEFTIVGCDVNWEDPRLYCDATGERITSAYAEPEECEA